MGMHKINQRKRDNIMSDKIPYKIYLEESEMPTQWYNVRADMKNKPAPILNPATMKPVTVEELAPIFCEELAKQELDDTTPYFDIPQEIRDFYKMYRPSPLTRAYCLEKKLDTPAHIYYKFEGNNTSGSHKLNSAIAQAYYFNRGIFGGQPQFSRVGFGVDVHAFGEGCGLVLGGVEIPFDRSLIAHSDSIA